MAVDGGTVQTFNRIGLRESLSDLISNIDPTDTPFYSGAGDATGKAGIKVAATLVEWQTDSLASTDANNHHLAGDDASFSQPAKTVRLGNYTQISRKTSIVAGTVESVSKAGRKSEIRYQLMKRSMELKRDKEVILTNNVAGTASASGTAPRLASLGAWVRTNTNRHSTGASSTDTDGGVPSAAATDGTQRAFTEAMLKDVLQKCWNNGAKPSVLMVGGFNKTRASSFSGIATRNFDLSNAAPKPMAVIGAIDVYVSDFSTIRVIPNRFSRARDAWVLDWSMVGRYYLRNYQVMKLGLTGDNQKHLVICEYTLIVKNEKGLGLIADLTTSA